MSRRRVCTEGLHLLPFVPMVSHAWLLTEYIVAQLNHFPCRSDTIGSYAFGLPSYLSKQMPDIQFATSEITLQRPLMRLIESLDHPQRMSLMQAFQALQDLSKALAKMSMENGPSVLEDPVKMDALVNPVILKFLQTRSLDDYEDHDAADILSGLRAAALLSMADMRRRSGVVPVRTTYQIKVLIRSLRTMENHPALSSPVYLWFLTVGALESPTPIEHNYFHSHIKLLTSGLELHTKKQYRQKLEEAMVIDPILESRLSSLSQILYDRV